MTDYIVTYRKANGEKAEENFAAESREVLFKDLEAKGVLPLSVREGKLAPTRKVAVPPSMLKGLVAGLIVVAAGGIVLWLLQGTAETGSTEKKAEVGQIAEVQPAAASVAAEPVETEKKDAPLPPQKVGEKRNGYVLLPSGRLHRVLGEITNDTAAVKGKYAIFKHPSENVIASILTLKPGEGLVGTPHYNGRLNEDFKAALKEEIKDEKDDTEEDRELRQLVREAKENLKKEMESGKDVEQILLDARKDCQELARYKQTLKQDVYEYSKKAEVTDEDVETYIEAANKILEEKGIAPIEAKGPLARLKLKMKEKESTK